MSRAGKKKERHLGEFDFPPGWRLEYAGNVISLKPWNEIPPLPWWKGGLCLCFLSWNLSPCAGYVQNGERGEERDSEISVFWPRLGTQDSEI